MSEDAPFLSPRYATLAREIAMDILPLERVLRENNVTPQEWERLRVDPAFNRLLESCVREWNAAGSTHERIRVKAAASLELSLASIHREMNATGSPLGQKVEAAKLMSRLAGLDEGGREGGGGGSGFTLRLFIGKDSPTVIEGKVIDSQESLPSLEVS